MPESYPKSDHIASYFSQAKFFIVVTELEAVRLGYLGSVPARRRTFRFSTASRPGPWSTQPIQWLPEGFSSNVKWSGMNLEYSRPSSVRVNNIWSSASILPYVLSDQSLLVVEGRRHVECHVPGVARRGSHASLVRFG